MLKSSNDWAFNEQLSLDL